MLKLKIGLRAMQYVVSVAAQIVFTLFALLLVNWWAPFFAVDNAKSEIVRVTAKTKPWYWKWRLLFVSPANSFPIWSESLPLWLTLFDTFDAPTDAGWSDGYFNGSEIYEFRFPPFWRRKLWQIMWLYRNPAYGFAYWIVGCKLDAANWVAKYDPAKDRFVAYNTRTGHFNFSTSNPWTMKLGWSIWNRYNVVDGTIRDEAFGPVKRLPLKFTPVQGRDFKKLFIYLRDLL